MCSAIKDHNLGWLQYMWHLHNLGWLKYMWHLQIQRQILSAKISQLYSHCSCVDWSVNSPLWSSAVECQNRFTNRDIHLRDCQVWYFDSWKISMLIKTSLSGGTQYEWLWSIKISMLVMTSLSGRSSLNVVGLEDHL